MHIPLMAFHNLQAGAYDDEYSWSAYMRDK